MDWSGIVELIKQVGFPIAITLYVLTRLEKAMKALEEKEAVLSEKIVALDIYIRAKLEHTGGQ